MKPLRVALFVLAPALLAAGFVAATVLVARHRDRTDRETAALPPHEEENVSSSLSATLADPEVTAIVETMAAEGGAVLVTEATPVDGAMVTETLLILTPEDAV